MNIKEAEIMSGVSRRNIRFYEQKGLLNPARNRENDYREYSDGDIQTLKLIRALRMLDMPVEQIREVLAGERSLHDAVSAHKKKLKDRLKELETAVRFCDEFTASEILNIDEVICAMDEPENREKLSKHGERDYAETVIGIVVPLLMGLVPSGVGTVFGILAIEFFAEVPALGYGVSAAAYMLWAAVGFCVRKRGNWLKNALLTHVIPMVSCFYYLWALASDWSGGFLDIIAIFGYFPILFTGTPLAYLAGNTEYMTWMPMALLVLSFCLGGLCGWLWDRCRTATPGTMPA